MQRLLTENCTILNDLPEPVKYAVLLKRPEISVDDLPRFGYQYSELVTPEIAKRLELEIKYEGYLKRQAEELDKFNTAEKIKIPEDLDFLQINTIAWEAREKLERIRPHNIGQAMRIAGVNYTDISALMIWLRKYSAVKIS